MEQIIQLTCQRCGHSWIPNVPCPTVCSRCHSPYYRTPRKNNQRFADVKQIVPNTIHTEPLMTGTPGVNTPQYIPTQVPPKYVFPPINPLPTPEFYRQPPPPIDYGQPPIRFPSPQPMYQEPQIIYNDPPVFKSEVQEESRETFQINPERDMPLPLRKCKLCGYKDYGERFKNHKCRR
jgi:hypothetical protein